MAEDSKLLPPGNEVGARVVQPWTARFTRQTAALLKKNGAAMISKPRLPIREGVGSHLLRLVSSVDMRHP